MLIFITISIAQDCFVFLFISNLPRASIIYTSSSVTVVAMCLTEYVVAYTRYEKEKAKSCLKY